MQLNIQRESFLKAINLIAKAADKRHSNMPILGNIRLELQDEQLTLTASDLEVELKANLKLPQGACIEAGETTVPATKLQEICKSLPKDAQINFTTQNEKCQITSGKSRFTLGTLPASDYPSLGEPSNITQLPVDLTQLHDMIQKTQFAMAVQDVRYYLTGMLFEVTQQQLATAATDGHRLAVAQRAIDIPENTSLQAILPRKAVLEIDRLLSELSKLLHNQPTLITLSIGREFLQATLPFGELTQENQIDDSITITFTARLIEGRFPDYRRVFPTTSNKIAIINREKLTDVLRRVSILSNEKSRGVSFTFTPNSETAEVRAQNSDHDEAVETLAVQYNGETLEISFSAAYLQDAIGVLQGNIELHMEQATTAILLKQAGDALNKYVIMPVRI